MERIDQGGVVGLAVRGETATVEFKQFETLDAHHKNVLCSEIAAMANGGGGRLLVGVEDGTPGIVRGLPTAVAGALAETGWLQKLLRERAAPQPDVDVYSVAFDDGRQVVVVDVTAPWLSAQPLFSPVILTRDVADERGRIRYAKGTVLVRDHTECRVVIEGRQWDLVMSKVLSRYREEQMEPLLRTLVRQGLVALQEASPTPTEPTTAKRSQMRDALRRLKAERFWRTRFSSPVVTWTDDVAIPLADETDGAHGNIAEVGDDFVVFEMAGTQTAREGWRRIPGYDGVFPSSTTFEIPYGRKLRLSLDHVQAADRSAEGRFADVTLNVTVYWDGKQWRFSSQPRPS